MLIQKNDDFKTYKLVLKYFSQQNQLHRNG